MMVVIKDDSSDAGAYRRNYFIEDSAGVFKAELHISYSTPSEYEKEITEGLGLSDAVVDLHYVETLIEDLGLSDTLGTQGSILSATILEGLGLSDEIIDDHYSEILTEALGLTAAIDNEGTFSHTLTEDLGLADSVDASMSYLAAIVEGVGLGDAYESLNWTQWIEDNEDILVTRYYLTLTGDADSTTDIEIPIKSFQGRLRSGEPTWLSVVIPGIVFGGIDYAAEISSRSNGDLVVEMAYLVDGVEQAREQLVRVDLETIVPYEGGTNESITLSGHRTESRAQKTVILENSTYYSLSSDGKILYRFAEPDLYLKPGDTVQTRTDEFVVGLVTFFIDVQRQQMELTEN